MLDVPTLALGGWHLVDGAAVGTWLARNRFDLTVLERVDARPTDGRGSIAQFAHNAGGLGALLTATGRPLSLVPPSVWKRRAGLVDQPRRRRSSWRGCRALVPAPEARRPGRGGADRALRGGKRRVMQLRPYQQHDVERLRAAMRASRRVVYVAPTASGKTVLFAHIAQGAAAKGRRVLILLHRIELVRQTVAKLAAFGVEAGLVTAGSTSRLDAGVVVAAVQTLERRGTDLGKVDLVVVDEAHHAVAATWRRVLNRFAGAHVLGVTATPERLDGRGLGELFDAMVLGPEVAELVQQGYLAQFRAFARLAAGEDLKAIRSTGGDYDRNQLAELMLKLPVTDAAVQDYLAMGEGRPAFAFCVSRCHA